MKTNLTPQDLISFEEEIGECFNNAQIRAPIHLYSGNEEKIIKIFEDVKEENKGIVAAAMFDWSKNVTRESLHLKNKARTIIGADVLYDPETCTDLANACSI